MKISIVIYCVSIFYFMGTGKMNFDTAIICIGLFLIAATIENKKTQHYDKQNSK